MLASVFFMQPLGQISGNLISLIVLAVSRSEGEQDLTRSVDIAWRWVIGVGVIPGVIALFFRIAIPETPRYLLDIEDDPIKAEFDTTQLFGEPSRGTELEQDSWGGSVNGSAASQQSRSFDNAVVAPNTIGIASSSPADWTLSGSPITTLNSKWTLSRADIKQYFWHEGNWRTLFATSLCWLLLDFGFYGIGLSSPQFLAKTWGSLHITGSTPYWKTSDDPSVSVYTMLMNTSVQALVILNVGSFTGGILLILLANHVNRVSLQKWGFLFLAVLFIALGTTFITLEHGGTFAIVLYVIGQMAFNIGTPPSKSSPLPFHPTNPPPPGPNATTYIIPAEVFPTRYRASCHGISAGAGKLGSILVQIFSAYYKFGSSPGKPQTRRYGTILIVFSAAMILGAAVTHFLIPNVQYMDGKQRKNKTLEVLAAGRGAARWHTGVSARNFWRSSSLR